MSRAYLDEEVVGLDNGKIVQWDARKRQRYNSGETLKQFGIHNLTETEKKRLGVKP